MDLQKTAREIGLFETALNLARVRGSEDVIRKVGDSLPLPDDGMEARVKQTAQWLLSFGKSKYLFLTPELALIQEMGRQSGHTVQALIAVPCDLEEDAKERLRNNLPRQGKVSILEEPYFPQAFFPGNGMMVIGGYLSGGRAMVLQDTYRLAEHYSGFLGKKVFTPYIKLDTAVRYDGWLEMNLQRLKAEVEE